MKYRDRQGREYEQTTSQDSFLAAAYSSAMGRALMKFLGCPIFSKCARVILDSKFSVPFIFGFAEKNGTENLLSSITLAHFENIGQPRNFISACPLPSCRQPQEKLS